MSRIKKSLEENKEEILKALPKEFHPGLEKEIEAAADPAPLNDDEELEAIKKELADHPDINEAEAIEGLMKNPTAHKPPPVASEAEQKKALEEELAKVKAEIGD